MDYWWIGYAFAIFAGIILSVVGLWGKHRLDQERQEDEKASQP